jgi:hypothetical protein
MENSDEGELIQDLNHRLSCSNLELRTANCIFAPRIYSKHVIIN